ncbi:MAG: GNAT family N-acetyltransferase [Brevefilum sp.]|nr:GNAT family N-acetyltransferase [Brevefilum sp.]
MDKFQQVLEIYRKHPCRTLPNAFWKTAACQPNSDLDVKLGLEGTLSSLTIWDGPRLMAFWCADPIDPHLPVYEITRAPFALVHESALPVFAQREFIQRRAYFRLSYQGAVSPSEPPSGFGFEPVRPEADIDALAQLISTCYPAMHITHGVVRGWLQHPVYDPSLWLWVVHLKSGDKAGLGIAERDRQVPEVSLEWIQVHPNYRKRGVGRAIVTELVKRVTDRVSIITVSGELESAHQPALLYRRCGFGGEDIWWLLSDLG